MGHAAVHIDDAIGEKHSSRDVALPTALRHDIVFGGFRPGQWLRQRELQARYGATRPAVRRALADLAGQGLVEHRLNFGYRVAVLGVDQRADICEVRVILETGALPRIVERAEAEDLAELEELARAFAEAVEQDGRERQVSCNFAFHRRFYALCGNAALERLIRDQRERTDQGASGRWHTLAGLRGASTEHFEMVEALAARDLEHLAGLVRQHIERF